jgi:nitrilase
MARDPVRVAVIQAAPVLFDRERTIEKACRLVGEQTGSDLILLPEAFVPAYPRGMGFGTVVGGRSAAGRTLWQRYWENAVDVPGPATETLGEAARAAGAALVIGVVERAGGTLYCTALYFGGDGALLGKHRKLKPTAAERVVWGEGDGSTLAVVECGFGRVGGLICWENYMPLARMAIYQKGVEYYVAPTADGRESWLATLRHIACEGRCFVLGCNQYVTLADYPEELTRLDESWDPDRATTDGGSAIVSPYGEVLAGPLYGREGVLTAELDPEEIVRAKLDLDVVGHYARPDVFSLTVDERGRG